jgi:hypothetical protein
MSECFPTLNEFLVESEIELEETVFNDMILILHFNGLQHTFLDYFPVITNDISLVRNPFSVMKISDDMSVQDYEALTDITTDFTLKPKFNWLNSGAVSFKNIRQCLSLQLLKFSFFPQLIW